MATSRGYTCIYMPLKALFLVLSFFSFCHFFPLYFLDEKQYRCIVTEAILLAKMKIILNTETKIKDAVNLFIYLFFFFIKYYYLHFTLSFSFDIDRLLTRYLPRPLVDLIGWMYHYACIFQCVYLFNADCRSENSS